MKVSKHIMIVSSLSIVGILVYMGVLSLFGVPLSTSHIKAFLIGSIAILVGMGLFLKGSEIGIFPFGNSIGRLMAEKNKKSFLILMSAVLGFFVSSFDPSLYLLATQERLMSRLINITVFTLVYGLLFSVGFMRTIKKIPVKKVMIGIYAFFLVLIYLNKQNILRIELNASTIAIGLLLIPVMMSVGIGFAKGQSDQGGPEKGLGLIGLSVLASIIGGLIIEFLGQTEVLHYSSEVSFRTDSFLLTILSNLKIYSFSFIASIVVLLLFEKKYFKSSSKAVSRMIIGFAYSIIGLVLFMTGLQTGMSPLAKYLGEQISSHLSWGVLSIAVVVFVGIVTFMDPVLWIIASNIEYVTTYVISKIEILVLLILGIFSSTLLLIFAMQHGWDMAHLCGVVFIIFCIFAWFSDRIYGDIAFDFSVVILSLTCIVVVVPFLLSLFEDLDPYLGGMEFSLIVLFSLTTMLFLLLKGVFVQHKKSKEAKVWNNLVEKIQLIEADEMVEFDILTSIIEAEYKDKSV